MGAAVLGFDRIYISGEGWGNASNHLVNFARGALGDSCKLEAGLLVVFYISHQNTPAVS
jgi:hypothetical protein